MNEGRAKRQVVTDGRGGKKFKNALAELAELRKTGGKRADQFEVAEEDDVYDLVDEDEYARIVQKRREDGGKLCFSDQVCVPSTMCRAQTLNIC